MWGSSPTVTSPKSRTNDPRRQTIRWVTVLTAALGLLSPTGLQAEVLQRDLIYDDDPWDPATPLEVGNCSRGADGSLTCDTRPQAQPWEETVTDDNITRPVPPPMPAPLRDPVLDR
jgi:hypothetical protein